MGAEAKNLAKTLEKLAAQIASLESKYREYEREFQSDGTVTPSERAQLERIRSQLDELAKRKVAYQQKHGVTTVEFDESEPPIEVPVYSFDDSEPPFEVAVYSKEKLLGYPPVARIAELCQEYEQAIDRFWDNYSKGLTAFTNRMIFASNQEAKPKYADVLWAAAAEQAYSLILGEAIKRLGPAVGGPLGKALGVTKALVAAYGKESARAAKAAAELEIADFVAKQIYAIDGSRQAMKSAIKGAVPLLQADYTPAVEAQQREYAQEGTSAPKGPDLIGGPAEIFVQIERSIAAFTEKMPSAAYFEQEFATLTANTPGWNKPISHGGAVQTGTLHFELEVLHEPEERVWQNKTKSAKWKLVTKGPNPDKLATSLASSMAEQGRAVWQVELPKVIKVRVEVEEFGLNRYHTGYIAFLKSPNDYKVRSNDALASDLATRAWEQMREWVLKINDIVGSS